MKFLKGLQARLNILKINTINSFQIETAYFGNNWGNIISTVIYTAALLIFINVLYSNVDTFAGYLRNEMLFLVLVTQLNFYVDWLWSVNNINALINDVRDGRLDLVLTKPIPSLFYVSFKNISLVKTIRDAVPNVIILSLLINWNELNIQNIGFGLLVFIFGQIAWHSFRFLFALPVFWLGESRQIFFLSGALSRTNNIPFEGFSTGLKVLLTTIAPTLIASQITTSVLLGKADKFQMTLIAGIIAGCFLLLKRFIWGIAIKNYTSASS